MRLTYIQIKVMEKGMFLTDGEKFQLSPSTCITQLVFMK